MCERFAHSSVVRCLPAAKKVPARAEQPDGPPLARAADGFRWGQPRRVGCRQPLELRGLLLLAEIPSHTPSERSRRPARQAASALGQGRLICCLGHGAVGVIFTQLGVHHARCTSELLQPSPLELCAPKAHGGAGWLLTDGPSRRTRDEADRRRPGCVQLHEEVGAIPALSIHARREGRRESCRGRCGPSFW